MREDSVENITYLDNQDENINVLNFAHRASQKLSARFGGGNNATKLFERILKQNSCLMSRAHVHTSSVASTLVSPRASPMMTVSSTFSTNGRSRQFNFGTPSSNPESNACFSRNNWEGEEDEVVKSRSSKCDSVDWDDEIMQFRANSFDSDDSGASCSPPIKQSDTTQQNFTNYSPPFLIESLRMLPTIIEVATANSEDSTVYVLSHEGTESVSRQESIDLEESFFEKDSKEESVEVLAVDISALGGKKVGLLLMHAGVQDSSLLHTEVCSREFK
ncbi:hypothetical protein HJC23_006320 [Cyclotella cryptica]|uniref:Kinesin motor domain-containing protein n=1 Tax=Cyclotella cryptica TaxID=29204 RepID=A0ABD3P8L2_9STRA|eukprot:CCRYP_016832-RA/>CCRYP_016832-RA protein AED:0.35 eAED:0.35 QI:0/-1/0/1/-1/1/1/0/274